MTIPTFLRKRPQSVHKMLLDDNLPMPQRVQMLAQLAAHGGEETQAILADLLKCAAESKGEQVCKQKIEEVNQIIASLEEGPFRVATFVAMQQTSGSVLCKARVRLEDGTTVFATIPDPGLGDRLQRGDDVLLDAQAKVLLSRVQLDDGTGEEARLERRIGLHHVEVSVRGDERHVFDAAQPLLDALNQGEVEPGASLRVCFRRRMALQALPSENGWAHYRFLERKSVPNVVVEQDIGCPPRFIDDLTRMLVLEMTKPELRRRYNLRRSAMKLLAGISGSGKTYSLKGLWRKMYDVMSEVTGVPVDELPPRVFRFRSSDVLSKWFGDSDKNIARFFSEVEQLAEEKFVTPGGLEVTLPVLVIMEELDGLTRVRGHDALYDRILSTILEYLDPTRQELRDNLILFVGTTNVAHQMDMAVIRRIGGSTIERFGRLGRRAFYAVLEKHLRKLQLASTNGHSEAEMLTAVTCELTSWLYSPKSEDPGQVTLMYVGSTVPEIRYRRDFLTAGLVDRAVQRAGELACDEEAHGCSCPGVTAEWLKACFHEQVRGIVDLLRVENVHHYLELPAEARVQSVQAIPQPSILPSSLLRAA